MGSVVFRHSLPRSIPIVDRELGLASRDALLAINPAFAEGIIATARIIKKA